MGFLTTITIYNDGLDEIKKHPEEFANKVYEAILKDETHDFGLGSHSNLVKVQKSKHADNCTIYVHCGNTVSEMNICSKEIENLIKNHGAFFQKMLHEMEYQLRALKKEYKSIKDSKL